MTSIILADDHDLVREALHLLLEQQPDFRVIAESGDGLAAAALVEKFKPDILVVDMVMPGLSGLEVTRRAQHDSPLTRVIVLSMYDAESYVVEALQAGVMGYVLKKSSSQELVLAIHQVRKGNSYLSPLLNERVIQSYLQRAEESRGTDPYELLTPREREIFQFAAQGLSNPQIAQKLSLSARTVEMHRSHFMHKLGLGSLTDLIKYAVKRGLV